MAKVGIVLSGGMARGAYEAGALKCISEYFSRDQVTAISASSVGTLNAYSFITGKLDLAESMWLGVNINGTVRAFRKLMNTRFVYDIVNSIVSEDDEILCNCYINSINVSKSKLKYIDISKVDPEKRVEYLKASVSFPLFTRPYKIDKSRYCDGALIDDIPVLPLRNHDLDYIIIIYFDKKSYVFENETFDSKIIKINFYDDRLIKNHLTLDEKSVRQMLDDGYNKSKKILDFVFENGTDDIDGILKRIKEMNSCVDKSERRITGDLVLRNFNRFVQKFLPKIRDEKVIGAEDSAGITNKKL